MNKTTLHSLFVSLMLMTVCACGVHHEGGDSTTHWLSACTDDTDCGGLACSCGVCTSSCAGNDECVERGPGAVCAPSGVLACSSSFGLCTVECTDDGDCTDRGGATRCYTGRCIPPDAVTDVDAGGTGGTSGAGTGGSGGTGAVDGGALTDAGPDAGPDAGKDAGPATPPFTFTRVPGFEVPNGLGVGGITTGPDGLMWAVVYARAIVRVNADGTSSEFTHESFGPGGVHRIVTGPDGNLWFTLFLFQQIGRITPTGVVTVFPETLNSQPTDIARGTDGNVWFVTAEVVGRVTPQGVFDTFPIATPDSPGLSIVAGPDGNLWFGSSTGVGRVTPAGVVTSFQAPNGESCTYAVVGPDDKLWAFCFESGSGQRSVRRVTMAGVFEGEVLVPNFHHSAALGPDGNVWFMVDQGTLGRISPTNELMTWLLTDHGNTDGDVLSPYIPELAFGPDGHLWLPMEHGLGHFTIE